MPSLLKRWLNKRRWLTGLNPHACDCKNRRERLEPPVTPTKYVCEELTGEFVKYWTKIREAEGEGLEEIQLNALRRWHDFRSRFRTSMEENALPLDLLFGIFDDYFFLGALRQYTDVVCAENTPADSDWVGIARWKRACEPLAPPTVRIEIKRLPSQFLARWTRQLVQDFLDTLLHEMIHAFLMLYSASPADPLESHRRAVETEGLTGHGPCWVKVAAAVAAEADRSLVGFRERWELGIASSRLEEREALREWLGCEGG